MGRGDGNGLTVRAGQFFRAGAGAWIVNAKGHVLACERSDVPGAWQLPQGGLDAGEEPLAGALRETREETGVAARRLRLVRPYPGPLVYELPDGRVSRKMGRGQVQYWFMFRLVGGDGAVRLPKDGEFRAWRWMSPDDLVRGIVAFKRPVYERLRDEFAPRKRRRARAK